VASSGAVAGTSRAELRRDPDLDRHAVERAPVGVDAGKVLQAHGAPFVVDSRAIDAALLHLRRSPGPTERSWADDEVEEQAAELLYQRMHVLAEIPDEDRERLGYWAGDVVLARRGADLGAITPRAARSPRSAGYVVVTRHSAKIKQRALHASLQRGRRL
jgi:hypothetical protein